MNEELKFYDREEELEILRDFWREDKAGICVVYGRRGIGKTRLLVEFSKTVDRHIYISIPEGEWSIIAESIANQLSLPSYFRFPTFEDFLNYILKLAEQKILIILDEFPRIVDAVPAASSILQGVWDLKLSRTKVKLVLCGSSVGMMFKETLSYSAPLYGRVSRIIHLEPLSYMKFRQILAGVPEKRKIELFAIFGGTPSHFIFIDPKASLEENVRKILDPTSYLFHEPYLILSQETRTPERYLSILLSIAKGKTTLVEIANYIGIKATSLPQYLRVLEEMDLIRREVPATDEPWRSKLGRYKISDPFYRFWTIYVFPHRHIIETGSTVELVRRIMDDLPQFVSPVFEDAMRDIIVRSDIFGTFLRFGAWWDRKGNEIDFVGIKRNEVWIGEFKWGDVSKNDITKLLQKANLLNIKGEQKLFMISGKTPSPSVQSLADELNVKILTLEEISRYLDEKQKGETTPA